ncbi:Hpt domain-containing protein [Rubrivivax rivuli]|uniref:Hpt domain-containing protein n=1 Tax=Rubrivivax rivuli TaxID=1862385 RepID=A0A437RFN7_9BURK|nr:Hpt domain-containing protein [Rubrivivax rivuli]RVU45534.1 Hpt domain-containing protein [Rubrivivax rivuli]
MSDPQSKGSPGATSPAATGGFDPVALGRLRELDPDGRHGVLQRVLVAFETSLSRMLVQLAAEREGGNAAVVAGVAHTLKSSSASVGALDLAQACAEVERRLRTGEPGSLGGDIERLLAAGEGALATVRAMLHA